MNSAARSASPCWAASAPPSTAATSRRRPGCRRAQFLPHTRRWPRRPWWPPRTRRCGTAAQRPRGVHHRNARHRGHRRGIDGRRRRVVCAAAAWFIGPTDKPQPRLESRPRGPVGTVWIVGRRPAIVDPHGRPGAQAIFGPARGPVGDQCDPGVVHPVRELLRRRGRAAQLVLALQGGQQVVEDERRFHPWVGRSRRFRAVDRDQDTRDLYRNWTSKARAVVRNLRLVAGQQPDDPALASLIGRLIMASAEFSSMRADHTVAAGSSSQEALRCSVT